MIEKIFFLFLSLIVFVYMGYPLSLYFLGLFIFRNRKIEKYYPCVTIIITAYNEENSIRNKIENTLEIEYPRGKLQIIIASDGSTDRTNEIVADYREKGILFLPIPRRGGKENAQKEAIKFADGDILVFSDVSTLLDPSGILQIVSNFVDPTVGCVSSEDCVIGKDGIPSGEGFYVRYEMWLRRLESNIGSVVGLSGSFFAARKSVCQDFSESLDSDFRTLLNSVKMGMRGISDPLAIGYYRDIANPSHEFERKVRTVLRGISVFFNNTEFLNVFKYGLFSYEYFCHKFLRWIVPLFLIIVFLSNIVLAFTSWIYFSILFFQILICIFIIALQYGMLTSYPKLLYIPIYFITVNVSIAIAWFRYIRKDRVTMWSPTKRF